MKTYQLKSRLEPEQRALVARYIVARRKAAESAEEADSLKEEVLAIVQKHGPQTLNQALVEIKDLVRYTYPEPVREIEAELKRAKNVAKADGSAGKVTEPALQFRDLRRAASEAVAA